MTLPPIPDSAFPNTIPGGNGHGEINIHGLTKRELFAAMAMQGAIASRANPSALGFEAHKIAVESVECADELIARLAEPLTGSQSEKP